MSALIGGAAGGPTEFPLGAGDLPFGDHAVLGLEGEAELVGLHSY
jgi:hypothetical protein